MLAVFAGLRRFGVCLQVTTVIFDKTGTLTSGKPLVTAVVSLDPKWDQEEVSFDAGMCSERGALLVVWSLFVGMVYAPSFLLSLLSILLGL